jgi:hypothetical protein
MMLNPTIPERTPILQFLEQLYELNNSDALAAFLSNPQPILAVELTDRPQTLQSHIDRAYKTLPTPKRSKPI